MRIKPHFNSCRFAAGSGYKPPKNSAILILQKHFVFLLAAFSSVKKVIYHFFKRKSVL
jgi:hypothetical protein